MTRTFMALVLIAVIAAAAAVGWHRTDRSVPVPLKARVPTPTTPTRAVAPPIVRVNLTEKSVRSLELAIDGPYRIRRTGRTEVLYGGSRLQRVRVVASGDGIQIGRQFFPESPIEIEPLKSPAIWIEDHQYRGRVRLYRRSNDKLLAVNLLPLEDYVATVVDSEMPAAFPNAARQAQAVAARTYVVYRMQQTEPGSLFDVFATTKSQRYLGFQYREASGRRLAGETEAGRKVARETEGMVCAYRGQLFCTYYCAVCGGRTTEGRELFDDAAPPLASVPCKWCRDAERYRWKTQLDKGTVSTELERHFRRRGQEFGKLSTLVPGAERPGLVAMFYVSDGRHRFAISSVELRNLLPESALASPRFTVHETRDTLLIEGRGHGHGVGMCQWGARGLALAGQDYRAILRYYYLGCDVVRMEGGTP